MTVSNDLVLHADKTGEKINRHVYGHFAEHLGRCIYDGFYVGENNRRIPHIKGIRADIIHALKNLQIPNLRWPGGCFADTYHWKDGIGPKQSRPGMINRWWGNVCEDNSFGTHDFLDLCETLEAEPYIAANAGSGTVQELTEWVQYTNFEGVSPMSSLRKKNGRDQPWKVKYWGIGNEAWGCGGNMSAEYYANIYRQYATFMTGWSNTEKLFRIASGANSADYHWTEILMRNIPHTLMEGIGLHHYAVKDWNNKGSSTGFSNEQYLETIKSALRMDEIIMRHSAVMDDLDPKNKVALVVDEWGTWYDADPGTNPHFLSQQNTMRDAVIAGLTFNIFNKHCARLKMANLAQTVNVLQAVILTQEEKMWCTPTYYVMEMFKVHQDAALVPLHLRSGGYLTADEKIPVISASASRDKEGTVHVTLVNMHPVNVEEIFIDINGATFSGIKGTILTSARIDDHNTTDHPVKVQSKVFEDLRMDDKNLEFSLPPFSVCLLSLR
jgi:alpha-N-arabinofuranosidase